MYLVLSPGRGNTAPEEMLGGREANGAVKAGRWDIITTCLLTSGA